jgi:cell division protein FtsW
MTYPFKRSEPLQPSASNASSAGTEKMANKVSPIESQPAIAKLDWSKRWQATQRLCQSLWAAAKAPVYLSRAIWVPALCLTLLGWFMVTSASMDLSDRWYGQPYFFAKRHGLYLMMSLLVFALVIRIPSDLWRALSAPFLLASLALLVLVLVPGIGREVNGSIRWIPLGFVNFQPSELAKLAIVFYVGAYLVRRQQEVQTQWRGFLKPFVVLSMFIVLLLFEPDFGAVVVLLGTVLGMMFMGGVKPLQFLLLITASIGMGAAILVSQPYRLQRLLAYLDPWDPDHILGTSYQLTQSLMAFGRGQLTGVGIGQSIQKQFYLPEAHTDFVFAIWAEETGLIGAFMALMLFVVLVMNLVRYAIKAQYLGLLFKGYVLYGISVLLSLQVFINLGVNTGLLPTKGLTLPFLSYGGSSLMMTAIVMAVAARIISELALRPSVKEQSRLNQISVQP